MVDERSGERVHRADRHRGAAVASTGLGCRGGWRRRVGQVAVLIAAILLLSGSAAFARATEGSHEQVDPWSPVPHAWGAPDRGGWRLPGDDDRGHGSGRHGPPPFTGCPNPPSRASLERAFRRTVHTFIAHGRARYGYLYRHLTYDYSITNVDIMNDSATVDITYAGSVRERLTGHEIHASGDASADYAWTACHWVNTDISY